MHNLDTTIECHFSESIDTIDKRYTAHAKYEIFILLDGDVTMLINSQQYRITNGAVVLLTSRDLHISINNISTCYKRITIMFDPHMLQIFNTMRTNLLACFSGTARNQGNIFYLDPNQIEIFQAHARKIAQSHSSDKYGDDLTAISELIQLMVFINRVYMQRTPLKPMQHNPIILNLVEYVDSHISEPITVQSLCEHLSYSEPYVSQLFSKQMGVSLKRFILTKKVAYAKQMLKSDDTILQVCEKCGFNDYSNFSRTFKQIAGVSPQQWRREHA